MRLNTLITITDVTAARRAAERGVVVRAFAAFKDRPAYLVEQLKPLENRYKELEARLFSLRTTRFLLLDDILSFAGSIAEPSLLPSEAHKPHLSAVEDLVKNTRAVLEEMRDIKRRILELQNPSKP